MREKLISDLKGALAMIGQAQEHAPDSSALWREIGHMYDDLDSLLDAIKDPDNIYDLP